MALQNCALVGSSSRDRTTKLHFNQSLMWAKLNCSLGRLQALEDLWTVQISSLRIQRGTMSLQTSVVAIHICVA